MLSPGFMTRRVAAARTRAPRLRPVVVAAAVLCGLGLSSAAKAAVILSFGQVANTATITATPNAGNTQTSIVGNNVAVLISQFAGGGAPINAFLNLNVTSSSPAVPVAGQVLQSFVGSATFTSLAGGGGINYLSALFTDFVFGAGSSLTLTASEPPGSLAFTSDVIPAAALGTPRALSFGFASVTPAAAIIGTTLRGFTGSVGGTVSASAVAAVPEPASIAVVGASLLMLGALRRRSRK